MGCLDMETVCRGHCNKNAAQSKEDRCNIVFLLAHEVLIRLSKYSCGGSFDAPCIYIQQSAQPAILTNPMYVKTIGVYPGCDENGITPAAVGAIVALAIIAMCAIGGLLLWVVKNYLHRDPNRQYNRQMKAIAAATAAARAKTIDLEYGESDIGVPSTGRESSGSVGFPAEAAKQEKGRRGLMLAHSRPKSVVPSENYEMMSNKHRGDGGEFSAVQLEDQTQVLDFAGITVTREVQIVREDGGGSGRGGGSRDGSENGSGSGSGGKVPGTGIGNLEGPVQILGSRGDSDSISERRQGHNHGVHPYPYGLVWSAHGHAQSDTSNSYSTGPSTSTMASYPILSASGDSLMARTDDTSL